MSISMPFVVRGITVNNLDIPRSTVVLRGPGPPGVWQAGLDQIASSAFLNPAYHALGKAVALRDTG